MKNDTEKGRLLVLKREDKILSLLFQGNRLVQARTEDHRGSVIGNIYVGKVKNVVSGMDAAFVEYEKGRLCFLPFKECKRPLLTNRPYDGRLVAGDEILIQIHKEAIKKKEPGGTANLSFPGKYLVLTTSKKQIGFSSKISQRQKEFLRKEALGKEAFQNASKTYGIVFRTNTEQIKDMALLEEELDVLVEQAERVEKTACYRTCYSLLYKAPAGFLKSLSDFYTKDYEKILTDDKELYGQIREYLEVHQKEDLDKLSLYEDSLLSLSRLYSVEARLSEALSKKVWLKSGGFLVIEQTEALVSIDVNSGKYTEKKLPEENFYKINLEAAEEIAFQLRLRNLSGIIIVDFINMEEEARTKKLLLALEEFLKKDAIRCHVVDMTPLGLVEITRKKERKSLWEQLYKP